MSDFMRELNSINLGPIDSSPESRKPQNCGDAVSCIINPVLESMGGKKKLPYGGLGEGDVTSLAKEYGSPVINRQNISRESLAASGPGTIIRMTRRPGDKNYEYGDTHAEVIMPNPDTGELSVMSFTAGKGYRYKPLDENYIASLPKQTIATNLLSQGNELERRAGATAMSTNKSSFKSELDNIDTSFKDELSTIDTATAKGVAPSDFARAPSPGEAEAIKERTINPNLIPEETAQAVGPALKYGTMATGAALGTLAGGPVGGAAGGTLGYVTGSEIEKLYEQAHGKREPGPIAEELKTVATQELPTGAQMSLAGEIGGPVFQKALGLAGNIVRPVMGKLSGVGTAAIETALKGGDQFVKAMRGKITGEEVVETAQSALQTLRDQRATAYQAEFAQLKNIHQDLDIGPINAKLRDLMKQYNVKINPDGTLDTSRIAMGKKGRGDIESIIEDVWGWGSKPGDKTPAGLDALKRQLDDFYSESSQARAFVAAMRKKVKDTITQNVPQYAEMTKDYAEATKLIKDIESGLMMRKQGMTGRITADQTLRRLVSAMKDNFPLRRDLVNLLGSGGQEDIAGLVAGHAMSAPLPRGLAGTFMIPEALFAQFVNPKIWPILAASSPRLQGEFLNLVGKGIAETSGVSVPLAKSFAYMVSERKKVDNMPKKYKTGDPNIYGAENINLTGSGASRQ